VHLTLFKGDREFDGYVCVRKVGLLSVKRQYILAIEVLDVIELEKALKPRVVSQDVLRMSLCCINVDFLEDIRDLFPQRYR
jgi:hypothetical protein